MFLPLFQPPSATPQAENVNFNQVLMDLYPRLNAAGSGDLVYWTTTELYAWFDECAQRLARTIGVFVERDTSITVSTGTAAYSLPSDQVSTIQADVAGTVLRPRTIQELEAFDSAWTTTTGQPAAFVQEGAGTGTITLYATPTITYNGQTLGLVIHVYPSTISVSNVYLAAPTVLQDYFGLYALAEARAKETKGAMQDVAQWARGILGLYEQTMDSYWGESQP